MTAKPAWRADERSSDPLHGEGLPELTAFQEFQRTLGDRLAVSPTREDATVIGSYSAEVVTAGN